MSASWDRTARLWNLENGQPIGEPLQHESYVNCVSFSTDGKLLATGCSDKNAYTWDISVIVKEAALDELFLNPKDTGKLLDANASPRSGQRRENARQLQANFFDNSPHHPDSSQSSHPSPRRRLLRVFSLLRPPSNQSIPLQGRITRFLHSPRAPSISPLHPPTKGEQTNPTPEAKDPAGNEERDNLPDCSMNNTPRTAEPDNVKGKQREEPIHSPMHAGGKDSKSATMKITQNPSPHVADVYPVRGFQRIVVYRRKHKTKSSAVMVSADTTAAHASDSSQPDSSSHGHAAHAHTPSQGQLGLSSQVAGPYTSDDSDSDSSMQGSWNKFFVKICFPCGRHYENT